MVGDTNGNAQVHDTASMTGQTPNMQQDPNQGQAMNGFNNEFNITNFMFDASTDWLGS